MKKKLMFIIALVCFAPIIAQNADVFFYGSGWATAHYLGKKTSTQNAYSNFKESCRFYDSKGLVYGEIEKLTKEQSRLLWGALDKFDYKTGELYSVAICSEHMGRIRMMDIKVEITESGSCEWYGIVLIGTR